jgi:hypothetical protein
MKGGGGGNQFSNGKGRVPLRIPCKAAIIPCNKLYKSAFYSINFHVSCSSFDFDFDDEQGVLQSWPRRIRSSAVAMSDTGNPSPAKFPFIRFFFSLLEMSENGFSS